MSSVAGSQLLFFFRSSIDEKYQNAMKNSDEQEARTESERALQKVIFSIMADNMELFKQFQDNPSFKKWLTNNMVFNLTYNKEGKPYEVKDDPMLHEAVTNKRSETVYSTSASSDNRQVAEATAPYGKNN